MRILQVSNGFPPTASAGVEIYTATISRELAKAHELFVLCREGGTELPDGHVLDEQQGPIQIRRVVNNFRQAHQFADFHHNAHNEAVFRSYVAGIRPDIIHFQHCIGLSTSLLAAAQALGIPYLLTLHDYWFMCPQVQLLDRQGHMCAGPLKGLNCRRCAWWPIESSLLESRSYRLAEPVLLRLPLALAERAVRPFTDVVMRHPEQNSGLLPLIERAWQVKQLLLAVPLCLTPSQFVRRVYVDYGVPAARIKVLPLGLDKAMWTAPVPRQPRSGPLRLGYIGTLMRHKGVHVLLAALRQLANREVKLTVYGYGDADDPYVTQLHTDAGPEVQFAGRYVNSELPQLLSALDAVVIPSVWHETFSIVAREALLAGVPVIASDVGALSELIRSEAQGVLFPAGDSAALAVVIARLAGGQLQVVVDQAATEAAVWSVEQHTAELLAVYEQLVAV